MCPVADIVPSQGVLSCHCVLREFHRRIPSTCIDVLSQYNFVNGSLLFAGLVEVVSKRKLPRNMLDGA